MAGEFADRHHFTDFSVDVRVDVEESDRVGRIVEQLGRRLVSLRLDQIVGLARSLSYDSIGQWAGRSNLIEESDRFAFGTLLELMALKCVSQHGLALRFHRVRKCIVVARTKDVANRLPGKAERRELFTYIGARDVAFVVFA